MLKISILWKVSSVLNNWRNSSETEILIRWKYWRMSFPFSSSCLPISFVEETGRSSIYCNPMWQKSYKVYTLFCRLIQQRSENLVPVHLQSFLRKNSNQFCDFFIFLYTDSCTEYLYFYFRIIFYFQKRIVLSETTIASEDAQCMSFQIDQLL